MQFASKKHRRKNPLRSHAPSGFTLIEVMASATMLILALAGTLSGMTTALKLHENSQKAGVALHIAETELETLLIARQADPRLDLGSRPVRHYNRKGNEVGSANQFELVTSVSALAVVDVRKVEVAVRWKNMGTPKQLLLKSMRK